MYPWRNSPRCSAARVEQGNLFKFCDRESWLCRAAPPGAVQRERGLLKLFRKPHFGSPPIFSLFSSFKFGRFKFSPVSSVAAMQVRHKATSHRWNGRSRSYIIVYFLISNRRGHRRSFQILKGQKHRHSRRDFFAISNNK